MMKKLYYAFLFLTCFVSAQDLMLKGVIDFTVPSGGSDGKALHLYVVNDIADLSLYGIGVANNGGGTDGQEYTFPVMAASAGDHIFLPRSIAAMTSYFESLNHFQIVIESTVASQNGDDAIELFFNGEVIETFGDIDCQATADVPCPNYEFHEDAWAYKEDGVWIFAEAQCTDDSLTSSDSNCPYPFLDPALSNENFDSQSFSMYPNPVNGGQVSIQSFFEGEKNIQVFDMNGRNVLSLQTVADNFDVSTLKTGFYLVQLTANNQKVVAKLAVN